MPPMSAPAGERLARVETKVDMILDRLDEVVPRKEFDQLRDDVEGIRTGRRWALATFLPILVSLAAVAVAVGQHAS